MSKKVKKQTVYKVYQDGDDHCVELANGKFRAIERDRYSTKINTYNKKPARYQQHRMMTLNEIRNAKLGDLFAIIIYARYLLDNCRTLQEAINELREFTKYLKELDRAGWKLLYDFANFQGFLEIDLKPEDD